MCLTEQMPLTTFYRRDERHGVRQRESGQPDKQNGQRRPKWEFSRDVNDHRGPPTSLPRLLRDGKLANLSADREMQREWRMENEQRKHSAFSLVSDPSDFDIFPILIPLSLSSTPFQHQTGTHPFSSLLAALSIFLHLLGVFPFFSLSPLLYLCQLTCRGVECRS